MTSCFFDVVWWRFIFVALVGVRFGIVYFTSLRLLRIDNYDQMPPFFMSIVSPSNFWLYLSRGADPRILMAWNFDPTKILFQWVWVCALWGGWVWVGGGHLTCTVEWTIHTHIYSNCAGTQTKRAEESVRRPFVFQSEELFPAEPKPLGSYFAVSCPGNEYHRRVDMWASQRRACAVPLLHRRQAHGTLYICADTQANSQKHTSANKVQSKITGDKN